MSDYGTMIRRINDECAWPEVSARIPNAIQAALRYYEGQRFWFNEGSATASTVADQQAYAVPTDLIEVESLTVTNSGIEYPMKRRPWSWMRERDISSSTGLPRNWSYFADQLYLWVVPDAVYTLTMSFAKRLTAPSALTDTSAWFTHGEELIRRRAEADLASHPSIKEYDAAAFFRIEEERALMNLRAKSEQKISTGRLSLDPSLVCDDGTYDINYQ